MQNDPELILIVCEGKTEAEYFRMLQKCFRLPTWIKVLPELEKNTILGQHEKLIDAASTKRALFAEDLGMGTDSIETWAVCDRDNYNKSFSKLKEYAEERKIELGFSDPQFENYLLQHFSKNKSSHKHNDVMRELSEKIEGGFYRKGDLSWLYEMVERKHSLIEFAACNAREFSNHTKQPFFTVQELVLRLLRLVNEE